MDTLHYFRSYKDYFWQWEEGGEVIAIPGASTICYREQLIGMLSNLTHFGLPSLGSVLLVVGALNPEPQAVFQILEKVGKEQPVMQERAAHLLKLIAALPQDYKQGVRKLEVLRALFRGAHRNINRQTSIDILSEFRQIRFNGEIYTSKDALSRHTLFNDLRPLSMLADKFSNVDDIKRAISGLPVTSDAEIDIDLETEQEIPEPQKEMDLIDELMERQQTFPVGALVRRIWSGLNIPFHNVVPSEQPLGGVSDITNKGDFHRLLTSEFAHDDVTFLSRLANNEALYLNREVPPESNKKERVILIDVSIRNWGTPKTIAYALLIAIAKHPKTDIACSAYVVGDTYKQISFDSVDDIIAAMQELAGCMHPGNGIRKFMDDFRRKKNMELIMITNPDTLKVPGLSVAVQDYLPFFRFWLIADQEGDVDVYKNQKNSRKHHQHFKLPLEELWSQKRPKRQQRPLTWNEPPDSDYPILFPGCPNRKRILLAPDNTTYVIGKDRSIYRVKILGKEESYRASKGWEMIYESVLYGIGKAVIGVNESGHYIVMTHSPEARRGMIVNLNTNEKHEFPFAPTYYYRFTDLIFLDGAFYLITHTVLYTISLNGEITQRPVDFAAPLERRIDEAYKGQLAKIKELDSRFPICENYLRKVYRMGVSDKGRLVVNKHELYITNENLTWLPTASAQLKYTATQNGDVFSFGPRYSIRNTGSGMVVLTDSLGEKIYIPLALDRRIGIATARRFAGNLFYKRDSVEGQSNVTMQVFWEEHMREFLKSVSG